MAHSGATVIGGDGGYVYVLREREFVRLSEWTFKAGHTQRTMKQRLASYSRNTEVHLVVPTRDSRAAERAVLRTLRSARELVRHRPEYGHEYFTLRCADSLAALLALVTSTCQRFSLPPDGHDPLALADSASGDGGPAQEPAPVEVRPEDAPLAERHARLLLHSEAQPAESLAAILGRMLRNEASVEDEWAHYAHSYRRSWGVDRVDEAFLRRHGVVMGSDQVDMLMQLLFRHPGVVDEPALGAAGAAPRALRKSCDDALRLGMVQEVMDAVGLAHPFDLAASLDFQAAREALLRTSLFARFGQNARLFCPRVSKKRLRRGEDVLDDKRQARVVIEAALGAIGLALVKTKRNSRAGTYRYALDPAAAAQAAALLNLKLRQHRQGPAAEGSAAPPPPLDRLLRFQPAYEFLDATGIGEFYGQYIMNA